MNSLGRMTLVGRVAVANLVCIGACLLVHIALFGTGTVHVDQEAAWKLAVDNATGWLVVVLTFPVGWFSFIGSLHVPNLDAPLFVPLNAYAWGLAAAWLRGDRRAGPAPS
jgi:hypothetical protein